MIKAAIYARYSSDQQSAASIEDQVRLCQERAAKEGWNIAAVYSDHAISGASMLRPGIQQLMNDAALGKFDIVLAEALDRLSRDQADIASFFKKLSFAGVRIFTLSEGEIGTLHIGLKGTMNAIFLKDLADKTRRGLRGRVEQGKSGGGKCYGYDVEKTYDSSGLPLRGGRTINPAQAAIVVRIFEAFAAGNSPKAIAKALNAGGVSGPSGKGWGPSTIYGNRDRGTGILNNELYIGRLVWNRLRYVKDPDSGRRVSRQNEDSALIVHDVPELRIVSEALWERVKARQRTQKEKLRKGDAVSSLRRPRYLFSGLMKCGCCGGGFVKISKNHFGCATARNKGTCGNLTAINRARLETAVFGGLQERLMDPALLKVFSDEYARHRNRLAAEASTKESASRAELAKSTKELDRLIDAIASGVPAESVRTRMIALQNKCDGLKEVIAALPEKSRVLIHPRIGERYRQQVAALCESLSAPGDDRGEAVEIIRDLVEAIVLTPRNDNPKRLTVNLRGRLAAMLALGTGKSSIGAEAEKQIMVVAGAGFEPTTFRL